MNAIIIILIIVMSCQMFALVVSLLVDALIEGEKHRFIKTKKILLKFFIPFSWFIPMVVGIMTWWRKLP